MPRDEVIGRNCRLLPGAATRQSAAGLWAKRSHGGIYRRRHPQLSQGWQSVLERGACRADLRRTGRTRLFLRVAMGHHRAARRARTIVEGERVAKELRHRTDNLFAVLTAIVRLSARARRMSPNTVEARTADRGIGRGASRIAVGGRPRARQPDFCADPGRSVMRPYRNAAPIASIWQANRSVAAPARHATRADHA